jgi:hypothetical protein
MNLLYIFTLFLGVSPFILDFTIAQNTTTNNLLEPKEYYLIILGILVGTLIFMFIAFSFLCIRNNRTFNNMRRRITEYHNPLYPRYDIDEEFVYYENRLNNQQLKNSPYRQNSLRQNSLRQHNIFNQPYRQNSHNSINSHNSHNSFEYPNNAFRDYEPQEINNDLYSVSNKNKNDYKEEEYLEIKEPPTLKRSNSCDINENTIQNKIVEDLVDKKNFNEDKNNLLNELRKSLPNLIPKNMID